MARAEVRALGQRDNPYRRGQLHRPEGSAGIIAVVRLQKYMFIPTRMSATKPEGFGGVDEDGKGDPRRNS